MTTGGIWRIGIPGFHELDQHLEAPLLPGVRVMVTLVFASCYFLSFPLVLLLFLLLFFFKILLAYYYYYYYYSHPPLFYLHSIGLWALLCLLILCFVLMFGRIAFSCACCFEKPTKICCRCFALFVAYPLVVRFVVLFIPCVLPLLIMS